MTLTIAQNLHVQGIDRMKYLLSTLIFVLSSAFSFVQAQTITAPTLGSPNWASDHLELPVYFAGTGDLNLSVTDATCPVQLSAKTITLPLATVIFIAPKGRSNCVFTIYAQNDQGDDAKWKLEVSATGDTGFNVVVNATGTRDPVADPQFAGIASVDVHGGWGDLRVDGNVRLDSALNPDGKLALQYQDSKLQLADDSGARDHPAGDVGRGLYFSQGLGLPIGQFSLGVALPFGQTIRIGAGWRGEYACGQVSSDINFTDPIFALQAGANGARASLSYRPSASEKWGFGLEYRNADWFFGATATEARGSAEVRGFSLVDGLGWVLLKASAGYDGTNFTTRGQADSENFGIGWDYNASNPNVYLEGRLFDLGFLSELRFGASITYSNTPGYVRVQAIYNSDGMLEIALAGTINTAKVIGASGGISYSLPLEGRLTVGLGFDIPDVTYRSNYALTGKLSYGTGGFLISLEMNALIFNPSQFTATLKITQWSFIGVNPPIPTVRFVDSGYTAPIIFSSPCN
jgi:hypothetical protein